ncbi:MAG: serine/threonine protein kinase [bacterium]|nr:serine/threonine protein kinase [bacterium]
MQDDTTPPGEPDDDLTLPLDHTVPLDRGAGGGALPADEAVGTVIGPYQLVKRIGQGGMGDVWLAEQSEPIRRRVALKVIKQGMDTRAVVARFDAERQALALMDHPCIAKVLDAGATGRGRPFFVMEYVEGLPITDYCNRRNLGTRERLELFVRVCEGVQHAHQKAVIHRDLKPSNIMVTEVDGRPVPKIIDFGVAKATTQRLTEMTMFTEMGQLIGTPEYMSPEQAAANDDDIDTRADVYALGVVLYELLAGALPFESGELRRAGYDAIRRLIIEQDPPRPSTRFGSLGARATQVAAHHGTAPQRLRSELRGDLDWITMKALEKNRDRRYETANGLAADVRRHLKNEPVTAGPPSAGYRLGKLVRRNRGTFAALAVIAVVMVGATVVSSVMYKREQAASRAAQREATRSEQVSRFLGDMLTGVGPHVARGRDTELLEAILADTDKRLGTELADQPEVEAALRLQLSHTYRQLGDWDAATEQIERVKELQATRNVTTPGRGLTASAEAVLAWARGDLPAAETLYRESLAAMSGQAGIDSLVFAEATLQLGNIVVQMGRYDEADSLMHGALGIYRRLAPESDGMAVTLNSLGNLSRYQGNHEAAETNYREALALHRRVLGEDHPYVATDLHNLGRLLEARGNIPEAEQMLLASMAVLDKVHDGPHADKAQAMRSLAEFYLNQAKLDQADSLTYGALAMARQLYGDDADATYRARVAVGEFLQRSDRQVEAEAAFAALLPDVRAGTTTDPDLLPDVLHRLATTYVRQGRDREALPLFEESIALFTALGGGDHPQTLLVRNDCARSLTNLGDDTSALQQLQVVLETRERVIGPSHPETAITRADLGRALWRLDRLEEAEASMRRGRDDYAAAKGPEHPGGWTATMHLAGILRDLGRFEDATRELQACEAFFVKQQGEAGTSTRLVRLRQASIALCQDQQDEARRLTELALDPAPGAVAEWLPRRVQSEFGSALMYRGRLAEAAPYLRSSYDLALAANGPADGDTQQAARLLVKLSEKQGNAAEAARWRAKLG